MCRYVYVCVLIVYYYVVHGLVRRDCTIECGNLESYLLTRIRRERVHDLRVVCVTLAKKRVAVRCDALIACKAE